MLGKRPKMVRLSHLETNELKIPKYSKTLHTACLGILIRAPAEFCYYVAKKFQ